MGKNLEMSKNFLIIGSRDIGKKRVEKGPNVNDTIFVDLEQLGTSSLRQPVEHEKIFR